MNNANRRTAERAFNKVRCGKSPISAPVEVAAKVIALMWAFCALVMTSAEAHEFEDGFVERSVAVKIRGHVARVEYSIGLNPKTREQLIDIWKQEPISPGSPIHPETKVSPPAVGTETRSQDNFLQLAGESVSARLHVSVNKEHVPLNFVSSLQSSRHHVDATVTVEFKLPSAPVGVPVAIEIRDGNFFVSPGHRENGANQANGLGESPKKSWMQEPGLAPAPFGGGFRYALKATGKTVLSRSNVASILIRADRRLDADLSSDQLCRAFTIEAEVVEID